MDPQLSELSCLVGSFKSTTASSLNLVKGLDHEFDQFLHEIMEEARSIFRKPKVDSIEEEDEEDEVLKDGAFPVLLPQTPKVKSGRKKTRKVSDVGLVVSRVSVPTRPSRAASRAAKNFISTTVKENLRKKKRRPSSNASSVDSVNFSSAAKVDSASSLVEGTSSTSSLTRKLASVKIESRTVVHFGEAEKSDGEPQDKKRRLKKVDEASSTGSVKGGNAGHEREDNSQWSQHIAIAEQVETLVGEKDVRGDGDASEPEGIELESGESVEMVQLVSNEKLVETSKPMDVESAKEVHEGGFGEEPTSDKQDEPALPKASQEKLQVGSEDKHLMDSQPPSEELAVTSSKMTRSVSHQMLRRGNENSTDDKARKDLERSTSSVVGNKADVVLRRITRSVSQQNIQRDHQEKDKVIPATQATHAPPEKVSSHKVEDMESRRSERKRLAKEVPAIRVVLPSVSNSPPPKIAAVPRTCADKQKAASSTNLRSNLLSPTLYSKAPSASNLITAAKLSAYKTGTARKITPQSPTRMPAPAKESVNNSGGLRSRVGGVLTASPLKGLRTAGKVLANISTVTSFLPGRLPKAPKLTEKELMAQKLEELQKKKEKEVEVLRRKEERERLQRESKRKENEARQKKVLQSRQAMEQSRQQLRLQQEKEAREKLEAVKLASQMAAERRKKEDEERRKREEEERLEQEQEQANKRRKEEEEIRRKELEQKEKERQMKLQEEEEKARQQKLWLAESAPKSKQEMDSTFSKTTNLNTTYEVDGAPATHKIPQEVRTNPDTDDHEDKLKNQPAKMAVGGGSQQALGNPAAKSKQDPNSTFTKAKNANTAYSAKDVDSYEITPARHELPQESLLNPDNYDIADLKSDEDTDDEDKPKKEPAKWAVGGVFKRALVSQEYRPPNLDAIFSIQDACPLLEEIFKQRKKRFYTRTSSAVWDKPPMSHGYKAS